MSDRLSRAGADVLKELRRREVVDPDGGAVTSTETQLQDRYNIWIHWRTAEALERRGLVKLHCDNRWYDEGCDVTITDAGIAAAERAAMSGEAS